MSAPSVPPNRFAIFAAVVAATVLATGGYVYFTRAEPPASAGTAGAADEAEALRAIASIRRGPYVAFRDMTPGANYGRLAFASLDDRGTRAVSTLPCQRVHFSPTAGVCLAISTAPAGFRGHLIDEAMRVTRTIELPGLPSRARVARNGTLAAYTVFVAGDSYLASGLSTRTRIFDPRSADLIGDLESFAVTRAGRPFRSVDFNFWGVTFTSDAKRFYATLGTGGRILLVEGDAAARTMRVIAEDIECPSLSPDERHIAFKKRFGSGSDVWWRPAVVDLATLTVRELPEERRIDDQIEWLDERHILYAVDHAASAAVRRADVWQLAIDGGSPPSMFLADAESPAVVRP